MAAPNLAGGTPVVMKHASNVQQCAEALEKIFHDAGFPPGAYTNLVISSQLANQVIDDDRVQGVSPYRQQEWRESKSELVAT